MKVVSDGRVQDQDETHKVKDDNGKTDICWLEVIFLRMRNVPKLLYFLHEI